MDRERIVATLGAHTTLDVANGPDDADQGPALTFREVATAPGFLETETFKGDGDLALALSGPMDF